VLKKKKEIGKDENRDPKLDDQAKVKSDGDWIGKEGEVRCQSKIQEGTRRVASGKPLICFLLLLLLLLLFLCKKSKNLESTDYL